MYGKFCIYGLYDGNCCFYVGRTNQGLNKRLKQHIKEALEEKGDSPKKEARIRKVVSSGRNVQIIKLDEWKHTDPCYADAMENAYIAQISKQNALTNAVRSKSSYYNWYVFGLQITPKQYIKGLKSGKYHPGRQSKKPYQRKSRGVRRYRRQWVAKSRKKR